jgi:hypothetical protein
VLHGHAHEGLPDHDHELTAPLSASRVSSAPQLQTMALQTSPLDVSAACSLRAGSTSQSWMRDHGPPVFLMHCVLLT